MNVSVFQTILVIAFGFFMNYERKVSIFGFYYPMFCGFFTGIFLGEVETGLIIGGTLQLMTLGVTSFGGASIPDYSTAAIASTYLTVVSGSRPEVGVTIGIPIALIMVQLDVLNNTGNIFFQHRAEKSVDEGDFSKVNFWQWCAVIFSMMMTGIPIMVAILLGQGIVQSIFEVFPDWLMSGLQVAGGLLPVVGLGLLLRTMPVSKQWPALVLGFVLSSYLNLPVLGVALVALVWAVVNLKNEQNRQKLEKKMQEASTVIQTNNSLESEVITDDE